jgi:quercetin dioxygenase-like cupin family protein
VVRHDAYGLRLRRSTPSPPFSNFPTTSTRDLLWRRRGQSCTIGCSTWPHRSQGGIDEAGTLDGDVGNAERGSGTCAGRRQGRPKRYKVELENDQVRVLRIHYEAGAKSVMHSHPASVAVFLTDGKVKFTTPDGKSQAASAKAGDAQWEPAGPHLPENVGAKPFDLILVELKSAPAK